MSWYHELHERGKDDMMRALLEQGREAVREFRAYPGVIFDVYDLDTGTAYEVLTAKWGGMRSAHEQDEAIVAKAIRYLLHAKKLIFVLTSYDHEDLDYLHNMGIEHVHLEYSWTLGRFIKKTKHPGRPTDAVIKQLLRRMFRLYPLREWVDKGRRKRRGKLENRERFAKLSKKWGLPENFLYGVYTDWRLKWVQQLERDLPKWHERLGYGSRRDKQRAERREQHPRA